MDHHLEDPLHLESAMGVEFEHSEDVVVSEADLMGSDNHGGDIMKFESTDMKFQSTDMEFEHIEEQPMLMETESEEIIVADLMSEQFTLTSDPAYKTQDDQMTGSTAVVDSNTEQQNILIKPGSAMNLQFLPQTPISSIDLTQDNSTNVQPQIITFQNNQQQINKLHTIHQVATTKPKAITVSASATLKPRTVIASKVAYPSTKPLAIAPKPMTLVKPGTVGAVMKKVSIANVQSASKPGTMLAQIGKQLVVLPAGSGQKLKLVQNVDGTSKLHYLRNDDMFMKTKNIAMGTRAIAKVILQESNQTNADSGSDQSAVLTKINPLGAQQSMSPRYVTMQPNVPVSTNMVITPSSPSKQCNRTVKIMKSQQQLTFVKSPTSAKLLPTPVTGSTKKIIISTSGNQNVLLKSMLPKQPQQVIVSGTQRSQLHQINVPGKGVQYIRLVTNPTNTITKPIVTSKNQPVINLQPKTVFMADGKGNFIISNDKLNPPPLVMTNNPVISKVNPKPPQKLVRIAPLGAKTTQIITTPTIRPTQSLLAPITTAESYKPPSAPPEPEEPVRTENSKALQAIIEEAVMEERPSICEEDLDEAPHQDVEIEIEREQSPDPEDTDMTDHDDSNEKTEPAPVIIIKPEYMDQNENVHSNESMRLQQSAMSIDAEQPSNYPQYSNAASPPVMSEAELIVRPRKACNCTKSQCLKLYCDCFANGEFCNSCNCNNCHNNLENEELRQKAIRGCLERNPNAFRPKIGKAKGCVGPETVRRHNKGCNCKRSGCLKNYCECYEAKIACTSICKCLGCRNVEESVERLRRRDPPTFEHPDAPRPLSTAVRHKQPCSFLTTEVIEAVCHCLIAAAAEGNVDGNSGNRLPYINPEEHTDAAESADDAEAVRAVIEEFARCLQDIISAAHHATPTSPLLADEDDT